MRHFFAVSQKFKLKRVMSRFSVEVFRLIVLKDFVGEPLCAVFQKFSSCQILRLNGRGMTNFPVDYFVSHSAETFRRGTFQCVTSLVYRNKLC